MRKPPYQDGYLYLILGSDVALSAHYDLSLDGRTIIQTTQKIEFPKELLAALVIASVVDMVHPDVKVKLLTCIRILEETAKNESDDEVPF